LEAVMHTRSRFTRVLDAIYRGYQFLAWVLMGLLIVPVTLQILSRYTGLIPRYIWTEEVARFCFIWIIMVGATIAVRDGTHFEVDVLPLPTDPRVEGAVRLMVSGFMLIFSGVFVLYGYQYARFGWIQTSELTGINMIVIHGVYFLVGLTWVLFLGERIRVATAVLRGDQRAIARLRGDYNVAR
jgi:TRAP-type C4-dicarboxylate transport system permease small subunit